ncbi:MAG: hypothetical protein WCP92_09240 [bacterium]
MESKITYYKLDELLKAAESFAKKKNANAHLNRALRRVEGKKRNIAQKNVIEISHETLCEVMAGLTVCYEKVITAILSNFIKLGYQAIQKEAGVKSHFAFGEHWNELPKYAGYTPVQYTNWQSLKAEFSASENYDHKRPLPVDIQKDGNITLVSLYGFRIPEAPMVVAFGSDTATKGRIALCKTLSTKEYIAIAW